MASLTTPVSLLARLVKDKPFIWGSQAFYVGIALLCLALFGLLLSQMPHVFGKEMISSSAQKAGHILIYPVLALGLALTLKALYDGMTVPVPPTTATRTPAITPVMRLVEPFGVQMLGEERDEEVLALAQQAGVRWVRIYLSWAAIEPTNTTPDHYNWTDYDSLFANLASYDFILVVTISSNPSWAANKPLGPIDKVPLSEFAGFVGAVVERYKSIVQYWEFYNEPDASADDRWYGQGAAYAEMLKAVHPAVHRADPEGKVVFGGLAHDWWGGCEECFDLHFLDDVLAHGGGPYFDVMNYHYYNRLGDKWSSPKVIGKALALQAKLPPEIRSKPFLCTEIGEPYACEPMTPPCSHEIASRFVVQGFVQGMTASDYGIELLGVMWFTMKYYPEPGSSRVWGLLDGDLNPQPEHVAYQTLTQELAGMSYSHQMSGVSEVEGYVFTSPYGMEKRVMWSISEDGEVVSFQNSQVRIVDKFGSESLVSDGSEKDLDGRSGWVGIQITLSPLYVEVRP